jgi:hypothetical protein
LRRTQPLAQADRPSVDPLDELKRLGELRATGVLSEVEFAEQKSRLLSEI